MQKHARVIYNPTSGREIIKKNLADVLSILEQAGYVTSAHATTAEPDDAKHAAEEAVRNRFDLVVAAGGDGTINEVINGIAEKTSPQSRDYTNRDNQRFCKSLTRA